MDSDFSESDNESDTPPVAPPLPPLPPAPALPPQDSEYVNRATDGDGNSSVASSSVKSTKSGFSEPSNFGLVDVVRAAAKKQNVSLFSVNRSRLESTGTMARNTHKKNYNYKVAEDIAGRGRSWSEKSSDQIAAQAGKSRAISAFNNNPNLGQSSFVRPNSGSMDGEDPNLIELQKQHLRGIFAAACTDHEGEGDMVLSEVRKDSWSEATAKETFTSYPHN